jgi:hypothetical protein
MIHNRRSSIVPERESAGRTCLFGIEATIEYVGQYYHTTGYTVQCDVRANAAGRELSF